ncbi:MAG: protein kinase [Tepidisphaeraceae bacterium]|jgi:serine/threonine protein kinase
MTTCPHCGKTIAESEAIQGLCPECLLKAGFVTGASIDDLRRPPYVPPTPEELARYFPQLEILEPLGHGGMGAVYKARQKQLDRLVAVKILPPHISADPSFAERFAREAKALAKLNHPNVVTLYEFGQADGLFYFLMEYVDGVNLRQLLDAGRLSPREALAIVPQICDALQYAHDQGIVHRDIKPENILMDRRGRVKVADFGLAKLAAGGPADSPSETLHLDADGVTDAGKVMGTPQYMAPEQIEHPSDVDHRADIYSLGVVFYQMLTGELPKGDFAPPSRKVVIDVRLDEVVLRAMEKRPELRYQQVGEVKTQIETIAATPPSAGARATRPPHFSRAAIVGVVWAAFFLPYVGKLAMAKMFSPSQIVASPLWWLCSILGYNFAGLTAPLGTTMLGWIAFSRIRRSAGRLYGLGLAVFDGLLFPLLILDGVFAWLWLASARLLVDFHSNFSNLNNPQVHLPLTTRIANLVSQHHELAPLIAVLIVIVVDFFIIRAVWRAVNKHATPQVPIVDRSKGPAIGVAVLLVTALTLFAAWWFQPPPELPSRQQHTASGTLGRYRITSQQSATDFNSEVYNWLLKRGFANDANTPIADIAGGKEWKHGVLLCRRYDATNRIFVFIPNWHDPSRNCQIIGVDRAFDGDTREVRKRVSEFELTRKEFAERFPSTWEYKQEDAGPDAAKPAPRLQFRLVADANDAAPADTLTDLASREPLRVRQEILLDQSAIAGASVTTLPDNKASVTFELNATGAKRLAEITGANIGRRLAVVLDGKLLSAPTIRSVIRDKAVITGNFTAAEVAEVVANALSSPRGKQPWPPSGAQTRPATPGEAAPGQSRPAVASIFKPIPERAVELLDDFKAMGLNILTGVRSEPTTGVPHQPPLVWAVKEQELSLLLQGTEAEQPFLRHCAKKKAIHEAMDAHDAALASRLTAEWDAEGPALEELIRSKAESPRSLSRLQFRLVAAGNESGTQSLPCNEGEDRLSVRREILLDETAVSSAVVADAPAGGGAQVEVTFTKAGANRLAEVTGANIGRRLAVVFDGKVVGTPTIQSAIHDKAVITGRFTAAEAAAIAKVLNRPNP